MDVKAAIEKRQSIRKYQDKEVPGDMINELIHAAILAPSGNNAQPFKFLVVKDKEIKEKLRKNNIFYQDFVYNAPIIIVCCADPNAYKKNIDGLDDQNHLRAVRDLSIASAFLVLRATELELGTCFIGWVQKEKIKEILNIPKDFLIPYVITVGFHDEPPKQRVRKNIEELLLYSFKKTF